MDTEIGIDYLFLGAPEMTGMDVLVQQVVKRVTGVMAWDPLSFNIEDTLGGTFTLADVRRIEYQLGSFWEDDPRLKVQVTISIDAVTRIMTYNFLITPLTSDLNPVIASYIPSTNTLKVTQL